MLNKKGVQNSESNYLSNALWNFQPKNEENGSQTSNNNSPSKNNPIENMDIETIKLDEKDDENDVEEEREVVMLGHFLRP